jgi:hypothetical protein
VTFVDHRLTFINKKRRKECSATLEFVLRTYRWCEDSLSAVGNYIHNCPLKTKEALGNFKVLSKDEGPVGFAENLHSSPFNEGLSIGSAFKQILRGEALNSAFNVVSIFYPTDRK